MGFCGEEHDDEHKQFAVLLGFGEAHGH